MAVIAHEGFRSQGNTPDSKWSLNYSLFIPSASSLSGVAGADAARAAPYQKVFERKRQDPTDYGPNGGENTPNIVTGFPMWVNWEFFVRLEN